MWRLYAGIALVALVIAGLVWWRYDGVQYGKKDVQIEVVKKTEETNKAIRDIKKETKHETQPLDRDSIVRQLCDAGWVRNPDQCPAN